MFLGLQAGRATIALELIASDEADALNNIAVRVAAMLTGLANRELRLAKNA